MSQNFVRSSMKDTEGPQTSFYNQLILSKRPPSKLMKKKSQIFNTVEKEILLDNKMKENIKNEMKSRKMRKLTQKTTIFRYEFE